MPSALVGRPRAKATGRNLSVTLTPEPQRREEETSLPTPPPPTIGTGGQVRGRPGLAHTRVSGALTERLRRALPKKEQLTNPHQRCTPQRDKQPKPSSPEAKHSTSTGKGHTQKGKGNLQRTRTPPHTHSGGLIIAWSVFSSQDPGAGWWSYCHRAVRGSDIRMLSIRPPVLSPKMVPRSWVRLYST